MILRKLLAFCLTAWLPTWAVAQESAIDSTLLFPVTTDTVTLAWPQNVQAKLDNLVGQPLLQTSQLGMMVYDLTADSTIYAYNHRQTMRPASVMKLVTAITALQRLGGNYQLRTSLSHTGTVEGHTLWGDLVCSGSCDPCFEHSDLVGFASSVRQLGIDTICGTVRAERSERDTLKWGEGWCWDDKNPTLASLLVGRKPNFVEQLRHELERDSVVFVYSPETTNGQRTTVCQQTHTIDQVLLRMMKESDNLYAEALFWQLALTARNTTPRTDEARRCVKQLINSLGLNVADYRIADGSGLSLYNYVSPELLVRLLRYAYQQPAIRSHLLFSLPIAGTDGTLMKRMTGTPADGNVRAKTGTVTGISSLAGYCTAANGHELCFCIINQGVLRGSDGRQFQDSVCTALCE